ncbi:AAA family ATPase [Nostoc sp. CENA67]|uniref:AAA family ATPase n=1 Tax=Amazonocrinis nigriterrae CENA67 TaxID=2794033 RepID=A0A8J7L652_9NOST|nr:AAA family ATPase [Amazonocrinis nigriterrae]MBH8561934.1 AAA family ATPase [Amazonocrinis nigriterrae CENA67]
MYCDGIEIPTPYRGLVPYSQTDSLFFFGREKEQQIIIQNLRASRLTVLYGDSGVGKTSLLRAGVAYHLRQSAQEDLEKTGKPGSAVIVFPALKGEIKDRLSWEDPITGIEEQLELEITNLFKTKPPSEIKEQFEQAIASILKNKSLPPSEKPSLTDILKAWMEIVRQEDDKGRLFIILDQFEDYFDLLSEGLRDTFAGEFSQAVNDSKLNVHFLISIRENALAKLDYFKGRIFRNLLDNRLAIKYLNWQSAQYAIEKAIDEYNRQQIILNNLSTSRLTVLYGDSNAGKTSVLQDGIAYYIRQAAKQNIEKFGKPKFAVTVFNSWHKEQPLVNLLMQIAADIQHLGNIQVPQLDLPFTETLKEWIKLIEHEGNGKLFIILDQFEEYFSNHYQEAATSTFTDELFRAINHPDLKGNFLICIHECSLDQLNIFQEKIAKCCQYYLHLSLESVNIRTLEGESTVIPSFDDQLVSIEKPDLVTAVLNDIKSKQAQSEVLSEERIESPYLQMIMLRLWNQEMTSDPSSRQLQKKTYTDLGGAKQIVRDHLDKKLEESDLDLNIEESTSYRLFYYLVTPSGDKLALKAEDLLHYVNEESNLTEKLSFEIVHQWLTKLSQGEFRILRPLAAHRYEIFLDVLAEAILERLQCQRKIKEIEQIAKDALLQFESSQLDALLTAMQTGQKFQEDFDKGLLKDYYAPQLKTILQNILDNIREENQFKAHEKPIYSVCFSPDGKCFATGCADGTACLWDLQGNRIGEPFHHGDGNWVWSVCFSPDGQQLATGSTDGTVRRWDLQGNPIGKPFQVCPASQSHDNWVLSVRFSPDGQQLATGCANGTVRLWDLQGNPIREPFLDHQGWVWSVCFSPDGHQLAAGCADGKVRRWDWKSNKQMENLPVEHGVEGTVYDISFSPDEKYFAAASSNGKAYIWDLESNSDKPIECQGHQCWVYSVSFSHDSKYLATGSADGTVRLWDLKGNQIAKFKDHKGWVWSVSFSHDGHLVTSSTDGTVRLWRLTDNQQAKFLGHKGWVYSVSFSPDSQHLATGCADGTVRLWDLQGNAIREPFSVNHPVLSVAFSPDGKKLATGSEDKTARLCDLQDTQIDEFSDHNDWVWSISFSPDGKYLATGCADSFVRLWDVHSRDILTTLNCNKNDKTINSVWSVSFSPDGQQLATGSADGFVRLWDLQGNLRRTFPGRPDLSGHTHSVWSVSFSPDGEQLVSGSADGTVCLWNLKEQDLEKQLLQKFQGHNDWVWSVSFSPDGKYFGTGSADGTARLWDLKRQLVQEFKDHKGAVYSVSFSSDGKQLATASINGTVKLWSIEYDLKPILAKGCNWLKDYFVKHPEKKDILTICCDS